MEEATLGPGNYSGREGKIGKGAGQKMKLGEIRVAGVVTVVAAGAALAGCLGPTYGTGKTSGEQLVSDIDGMLSLGSTNKADISYTPRAELIRPKDKSVLPTPQDAVDATNNPNWPESPERRSARIQAEADAREAGGGPVSPDVLLADKEGVSDEERAGNTVARRRIRDRDSGSPISPQELNAGRDAFKKRLVESQQGSPAQRKYLSEPPVNYRQPSASAPVGDPGVDESVKEAKLKKKGGFLSGLKNLNPF